MSNPALKERLLDAAITEVVQGADMPDLATVIARATASERRRAVEHCERAQQRASFWNRGRMQLAALLLGSIALVVGIWAFTQPPEDKASAGQPHEDRVHDPKRVVPRDKEELLQMLEQVVSMQARGCSSTLHTSGQPPVKLDYDIGMGGFVPVEGEARDIVLKRLKRHGGRKQQPKRRDFAPGIRLVMTLKNGRTLHCLIQFNRTMRVFADKDINIRGDLKLGNVLGKFCGLSSLPSQVALGYVTGSTDGHHIDTGEPMYPSDMPVLRCYNSNDDFIRERIERFTKLHTLDMSHSARTLTEDAFVIAKWRPEIRKVIAGLRTFGARGGPLADANAQDVLGLMPKLEELDLANCPQLAEGTLRAILQLAQLQRLDLSGCTGIPPEYLVLLKDHATLAVIKLSPKGLTEGQRSSFERSLGDRLHWQTEK